MINSFNEKFWNLNDHLNQIGVESYNAINNKVIDEKNNGIKDFENLYYIFFHDIQRLITSCLQRKFELENPELLIHELENHSQLEFPFFDYESILNQSIDLRKKVIYKSSFHFRTKFTYKLINLISRLFSKKIMYLSSSLETKEVIKKFLLNKVGVKFAYSRKLYLPDKSKKINELVMFVINYLEKSSVKIHGARELLIEYFDSYISNKQEIYNVNLLIVGTLGKTHSRLIASNAKRQGIKVMMIRHGESDGVLDEPIMGYCEQSFADIFACFGKFTVDDINKSKYLKGLDETNKQIIIQTNSDLVCRNLSKKKIKKIDSEIIDLRPVFVPTSFSGFNTYLPYRYVPRNFRDNFYKHLKQIIPNLKFKVHIKDTENTLSSLFQESDLISMPLNKSLDYADVFIFDYFSTAFTEIASTDKQIIYIDIGGNHLTEKGLIFLKNRCHYIDARSVGMSALHDAILNIKFISLENGFSNEFSLIDSNEKRLETVFRESQNNLQTH